MPDVETPLHPVAEDDAASLRRRLLAGEDVALAGRRLLGVDLSGLDLSGRDLSRCDLSRARLRKTILARANLRDAVLFEADLEEAECVGADLTGARLDRARAVRAGFGHADLTEASLFEATLDEATLSGSRLVDADLRCASLRGARALDADLSGAQFERADLSGADLSRARVAGARFDEALLHEAALRGLTGFEKASFLGVDIRRIDFTGACLLRREILDQNYLNEFRNAGRGRSLIYWIWWLTSDCGRSVLRWMLFVTVVWALFGFAYEWAGLDYGAHPTPLSPFYFSLVTLTTLGYGDVLPTTMAAQLLAMAEVSLGYVGLGGLLAILTSKMTRRAE